MRTVNASMQPGMPGLRMIGAAVAATALAGAASGEISTFMFGLDGGQEATPNTSSATGTAVLTYDSVSMSFDLELQTSGLALGDLLGVGPNASPIHIHNAPAGAGGPIVIDLGIVGSFQDLGGGMLGFSVEDVAIGGPQGAIPATDPAANESALFAGNLYVNIHTSAFPGGEIRGQVVPAPAGAALVCGGALLAGRRRR